MTFDTKPKASDFPNPHFIQGSDAPVFRGNLANGLTFQCDKCGHVLIENYIERDFLSVEIKCFGCGTFTTTPPLEPGEIFSHLLLDIGHEGAFLIGGTVDTSPGLSVTSSQAIKTAVSLTAPISEGLTIEISEEGLNALVDRYDAITGNKFEIQNKIISRAGDLEALQFPFAWSVRYLRSYLEEGAINIDDPRAHYSFTWLRVFGDVVGKWQHHPRFMTIAKDLGKPNSFLHTAALFVIADYLYAHGNQIGLSLENMHGEPNPDLYIRGVKRLENFYLEVKSPKALHRFGAPAPGALVLEAPVKACIDRSVTQINRRRPGALIIFSSLRDQRAADELERCVTNWLKRYGRTRKPLAAVVVMSVAENRIARIGVGIDQPLAFRITPILNAHFEGENPIITQR